MAYQHASLEDGGVDPEEAADEAAIAELATAEAIPHEAMRAWLLSWGAADELPPPGGAV